MQTTPSSRLFPFFICILLAASISACQLIHRTPPEDAVRQRISEFMNAKITKDWATAYTYFDAEYHDLVSEKQFERKIGKMDFKGFHIASIEIDASGENATAVVKVDVNVKGFDFKGNPETQLWVKEGWKWYLHVPPKDPDKILN